MAHTVTLEIPKTKHTISVEVPSTRTVLHKDIEFEVRGSSGKLGTLLIEAFQRRFFGEAAGSQTF